MNDCYVECLVARKSSPLLAFLKILLYGLAAALAIAGIIGFGIAFIPAILLAVLAYFVLPMMDLEFEYLYMNKEISIDKIMAKEKRKKVTSIDLNKMEIMAPFNSHELDSYKARNLKINDYSSKLPDSKPFAIVYQTENAQEIALIEPNEAMLKAIKTVFPRKVVEY